MTTDDITQIRQQIENLGNRMSDQFERVQTNMIANMKAYVLDAVHQKDLERLDAVDKAQQEQIDKELKDLHVQIDELQSRLDNFLPRLLGTIGAIVTIIGTIAGLLHLAHIW